MVFKRCFVPFCVNTSENSDKIFLTVPTNESCRNVWLAVVSSKPYKQSTHLYSCEDHFDLEKDAKNWMYFKMATTNRLILRDGVVPHKRINQQGEPAPVNSQLTDSAKRRRVEFQREFENSKKLFFEAMPSTSRQEPLTEVFEASLQSEDFIIISDTEEESKSIRKQSRKQVLTTRDISDDLNTSQESIATSAESVVMSIEESIVTSTEDEIANVSSSFHPSSDPSSSDNEDIGQNTLTNIHLKALECNSKLYLGIPNAALRALKCLERHFKIKYLDILIILKKIRTDDQFSRMGLEFGRSSSYCAKIFKENVQYVAGFLGQCIYMPDEITLQTYLPTSFRIRYANVKSIIDCFEIQIQKPTDPVKQSLTWSQYKSCNTMKYLISCTPYGFINYISHGYGGRTSDRMIVEESGYLDFLPANCEVLADRGFKQIADLLHKKNCKLIVPPSVKANTKLGPDEVHASKTIAALRIHIERVIRKLREFAMLKPHADVNHNLLQHLDDIVMIAAGIANTHNILVT